MKFNCTLTRLPSGEWLARHHGPALSTVEVTAASKEDALAKMRNELQYRSEWCPCSAANEDYVELDVQEVDER